MSIDEIVELIRRSPECRVLPPSGIPRLEKTSQRLPGDLLRFYELCGGVVLFPEKDCGFRILRPEEVVPSNPVLLGEFYLQHREEIDRDESANWYMLVLGIRMTLEIVTIDLGNKPGICRDSFWDVYATGNAKIVARSFSELLERLFVGQGDGLFWDRRDFDLGNSEPIPQADST